MVLLFLLRLSPCVFRSDSLVKRTQKNMPSWQKQKFDADVNVVLCCGAHDFNSLLQEDIHHTFFMPKVSYMGDNFAVWCLKRYNDMLSFDTFCFFHLI